MYFDLSVPFIASHGELQQTLLFLLGYSTIALDYPITGKVPAEIMNPIPDPLPFNVPRRLKILRRCTLHLSDPSQNHRLSQLAAACDIFALRPTTEKALQQACRQLECDVISLDFSIRYPFYFQMKTVKSALDRGVKLEICYAGGIMDANNGTSRRNLISNATQLIRATRGRGIIISSEAKRAVGCRSPADVTNLAVLWGLPQERGLEAVGREARSVVVQAEMKRRSYRGVMDVINPGTTPEKPFHAEQSGKKEVKNNKRRADALEEGIVLAEPPSQQMSKREQKRQAKKARKEALDAGKAEEADASNKTMAQKDFHQ